MRDGVRSAIAALGFLTMAPVGRRAVIAAPDLRRGLVWFPLIGALVGGVVGVVGWGATSLLPAQVAAVLAVVAGAVTTGLLHLDGLADTADGIGAGLSGRDPRDVMSDPRVGSFGVVAIVLDLLLKIAVLWALLERPGFPWEVVAAAALGRTAVLGLVLTEPYAGSDVASGSWTRDPGRARCLIGIAVGLAIATAVAGARVVPMAGAGTLVTFAIARWSSRHLGGSRGDTFGAAIELTESLALVAALAAA